MNTLQSVQAARSLVQLADGLARRRPASEVLGQAAGLAFAVNAGGAGSLASGFVADAVEGAVAGLAQGASGTVQAVSRLGGAAAAYVNQGARALGRWVDLVV